MNKNFKRLCILLFIIATNNLFAEQPIKSPTSSAAPLPSLKETQNIDTVLTEKVQYQIEHQPALKSQAITAASHNQVITLQGSVATKFQEKVAIQAAQKVKGVKKVKSQLTIRLVDHGKQ